ncbi:P1 [Mimosa mosaic virus]|uniref:P1 n=1 Tax=Mimosa mosaic virus TaxID=3018030 RepID=A0AA95J633_9VIRU|nr:P1 [Mimosa mosaic virus]
MFERTVTFYDPVTLDSEDYQIDFHLVGNGFERFLALIADFPSRNFSVPALKSSKSIDKAALRECVEEHPCGYPTLVLDNPRYHDSTSGERSWIHSYDLYNDVDEYPTAPTKLVLRHTSCCTGWKYETKVLRDIPWVPIELLPTPSYCIFPRATLSPRQFTSSDELVYVKQVQASRDCDCAGASDSSCF